MPDAPDSLSMLALTGASTIVTAMTANDGWAATRDKAAALFRWRRAAVAEGGTRPDVQAVAAELEESAVQLRDAGGSVDVQGALTEVWRRRLAAVLRQERQAAAELAVLIDEAQEQPGRRSAVRQTVTASGSAHAYGVAGDGSSMHVYHYPPPPQQPPSALAEDDDMR